MTARDTDTGTMGAGPPLILGFDCSGPWCAAALIRGDDLVALAHEDMPRGQAERLMPMLESLLAGASLSWRDLDAIGVGTGPGNFTGTRVAVAAARGLALGLSVPAIGVGVTEAAAHGLPRPCRVIVPGRHGNVFWQDFTDEGLTPTPTPPAQARADDLPPGPPVRPGHHPLAEGVARVAALRLDLRPLPRPAPIYLRPADAAPPSDAPPRILPG